MKALGIIAMIFAIICIFVPVGGPYLTVIAGGLAAFAVKEGLTFAAVAIGVNLLNLIFLSPSLWATHAIVEAGGGMGLAYFVIGAQVVAGAVLFGMNERAKTIA